MGKHSVIVVALLFMLGISIAVNIWHAFTINDLNSEIKELMYLKEPMVHLIDYDWGVVPINWEFERIHINFTLFNSGYSDANFTLSIDLLDGEGESFQSEEFLIYVNGTTKTGFTKEMYHDLMFEHHKVEGIEFYCVYFVENSLNPITNTSKVTLPFKAYKNADADYKMNALNSTFIEFSALDYARAQVDDSEFMSMFSRQDDWDGMHFIFDLSQYNIDDLASIKFVCVYRIIESENWGGSTAGVDCGEVWYYTDDGWVKFDDVYQSYWVTYSEEWANNLGDYIDVNGKVHISIVVHVEDKESAFAYFCTQFVKLEVSYN